MTSPGIRVDRVTRGLISALYLGLAAILLAGCGGSSNGNPNATAASVSQVVTLHYAVASSGTPRSYNVDLGRLVYVTVKSDVAGEISIPAFNTSETVTKGGTTVLVISADNPGSYAVVMRRGATTTTFAILKIPTS